MTRPRATAFLGLVLLAFPATAAAQPADLVITNARVLTGTGETLDPASLVVADGRIVSVSAGTVEVQAEREIDAAGMTVMPGLIGACQRQ